MGPFFESLDALVGDWVEVPVMFVARVTLAKLVESTDQLGVAQILIVVEIEQNLITRHLLEIDVIVSRHRHLLVLCPPVGLLHLHLDWLRFGVPWLTEGERV